MNLTVGDRVRFKDARGATGTVLHAAGPTHRPGSGLMYLVRWDNGYEGHAYTSELERVIT